MKILSKSLSILFVSSILYSSYNVGQTVTLSDQNESFSVCYGEHDFETLTLADFNGALNGGSYKVIHIDMSASW